ncbi:MAG: hypothetical protein NUV65_05825, partial [Candidatus Roizmanbacteria bacterium]|nr:hypothetical protein [Candidatus Roizmanbacteria bacterium]
MKHPILFRSTRYPKVVCFQPYDYVTVAIKTDKPVKSKPIIPLSTRREKRANLHYSVDKMGITKNIFQRQEKNRPKNKDK